MNNSYPHPLIAREGWPFLTIATVVALATTFWLGWGSLPFWGIAVFVLQFFRDPARLIAGGEKSVVSPADGRIVAIEKTHDQYADREALKVSVFNFGRIDSRNALISNPRQVRARFSAS